ncbi:hypothetical protein HRG_013764 [Hirsutella rhossiliensis]
MATGATGLRTVFTSDELPGILLAYMQGIKAAFAVAIGLCVIGFLDTLIIPWSRLPAYVGDKSDGDRKDDAAASE